MHLFAPVFLTNYIDHPDLNLPNWIWVYLYSKLRSVRQLNLNIQTRELKENYLTENEQIFVAVFHISRCLDIHKFMFSQSKKIKKHVSGRGWYCLATLAGWIFCSGLPVQLEHIIQDRNKSVKQFNHLYPIRIHYSVDRSSL